MISQKEVSGENSTHQSSKIKTNRKEHCIICRSTGNLLYNSMKDQLFSAPEEWNLSICPNCKLVWLNPYPIPEELGKIYSTYYTHENTKRSFISEIVKSFHIKAYSALGYKNISGKKESNFFAAIGGNMPVLKKYMQYAILKVRPSWGKRLLDVGAGSGEYLNTMTSLGWDVEGTETDSKAADFARTEYKLKIHVGFLSELALPDNSFDVITLNHVIEHVYDPEELLRECGRILRPGGRVVLLTPNAQSLLHKMFKQYWRGLEIPRHIHVFSVDNFRMLAEKAGLSCETLTSTARISRYLYSTSAHMKQGRVNIGRGGNRGYWLAFKSYCFQAFEELYLLFDKKSGEEIYFVGKKP